MERWRRFHHLPLLVRAPIKLIAFALVTAAVLYPKPWLVPTWIHRLRDMNSVLQPDAAGLAPLEDEARRRSPQGAAGPAMLAVVQRVVYERIPYAHDWDTWGVMDYLPNVDETLALGREDCDGRAVVAASLLRRMGYEATIVSDLKHVWVHTPAGETMSPGVGAKTLSGEPSGTRSRWLDVAALANLGRGVAYGIAAFPLMRETVIVAAFALLAMHPWSSIGRRIVGAALLFGGLAALRLAGTASQELAKHPALLWIGAGLALSGWLTLAIWRRPRGVRA